MTHLLTETVEKLSEPESLKGLFRQHRDGYPLPSSDALKEIILLTRSILFPGYFGKPCVNVSTIKYKIGVDVENLHEMLSQQIFAGLCFDRDEVSRTSYNDQKRKASTLALKFIERLPELRHTLGTDVTAAYFGDPAAKSYAEILSCYPTIKALTNYRMAHELFLLGVPLIPRFITEMAHSETGIDIHPGASIGHHFTIDHGTGIVIGETCIIGNYVKLYQGVTLGAKSFSLDDKGNPIKGILRHPIIEDNVVIYANATVLGRITIGSGCIVGANTWVLEDMAPQTKKFVKS
ncbi:MAG: serine acetyltransferase [Prevotella sp.]|nr:serine acetyltransferase [Prevotella sp.]MDD4533341.1 serine acetyltransferase [Prevotella sp.]